MVWNRQEAPRIWMSYSSSQSSASDSSQSIGGRSAEVREVDYWLKRYCAIPTCGALRTLVQSLNAWLRSRSATGGQRQALPSLVQFIKNESKLFGDVGLSLVDLPSAEVFTDLLKNQGLEAVLKRYVCIPDVYSANTLPFSIESPKASLMPYRVHFGQAANVVGDVRGTIDEAQMFAPVTLGKGSLPIVDELTKEHVERYGGWQKLSTVSFFSTQGLSQGCFLMRLEPQGDGLPARITACTQLIPEESNDTTNEKHSLWIKLNKLYEAEIAAGSMLIFGQNPKRNEAPYSYGRWTVGYASVIGMCASGDWQNGDWQVYAQFNDRLKQNIQAIYKIFPLWEQIA